MDNIEYAQGHTTIKMWPDFTKADVKHVVRHPRPEDEAEFEAIGLTGQDAENRRLQIVGSTPLSYMVYHEGVPAFMFGVTATLPHTATLWGFGTDATRAVIPAVTRYVRRRWLKNMAQAGVSRIEARVPTRSIDSLRWLNSCGMQAECQLAGLSVTGEPFTQLSYTWKQ